MAGLDQFEKEHADRVAYALDVVQEKALAANVSTERGDPSDLAGAIKYVADQSAAEDLADAIDEVLELTRSMPTNDDGRGTGPVHRGYVARLAEHGYVLNQGATGEHAVVQIKTIDEDETLPLQIGFPAQTGDSD